MSDNLQTPVSVFFYRRPEHLRKVMAKIREARPAVLFGVSDGPKPGNEEIQKGVEESRKVFREMIDWPCRWELLERETNLGSYLSVSRGLDWVFEEVNETIILEDDTVPDLTFFRFTAELLEKYREDERIGAVCGNNYDDSKDWTSEGSYRFTRYHHSWGWGTWKRAWKCFDREEKLLSEIPKIKKENWMKLSRREWAYWERSFRHTYAKKLDAWDYRWTLSLWAQGMYCIVPRVNLVRNIGFDEFATHTVERDFADLTMHRAHNMTFPLRPPTALEPDANLDEGVFHGHYRRLEGRRDLWQKLWDRLRRWGRSKGPGKER
jgi:GT2 family glycosyltransferase